MPLTKICGRRAFNFGARKLQIEHFAAKVDFHIIPKHMERKVKFKGGMNLGFARWLPEGAEFYVVSITPSQMIKAFFHEMTHVRQFLLGQVVVKPRHIQWKNSEGQNEKWHKREYAFAPWEVEADAFSGKAYDAFKRQELKRAMPDESVNPYHPHVRQLFSIFPQDEVFALTQEIYQEREKH